MNSTEYKVFVMQAEIAGQEIEEKSKKLQELGYHKCLPMWDWLHKVYRIKLPAGYEYVIEDGEIAFRGQRAGEINLGWNGKIETNIINSANKRPIIRKVETNND